MLNKLSVPMKYIGIPFKENGIDFQGVDCIQLAKLWAENECGIKVHQMPADIKVAQKNHDKYLSLLDSIPYHALIPGDIPFFAFPGQRWHCGVYIGYGKMLHVARPIMAGIKTTSIISPIKSQWQAYYIGAIRTEGKSEIIIPDAGDLGVIGLIISIVVTIYSVVTALTAPKPNFGNDTGSPKYGFEAISNTISNQLIYPIGFGTNKYGGNIIWYKNEADTTKRIIVLGIGKSQGISDVRLNDIPIAECPGCSYTAYLGLPDQAVDSRAAGEVKGLRNIVNLALTIQSSEKIPGGDPTVTCIWQGSLMKTWNGSTWSGENFSNNPAACLRYLLTMPKEDGGCGADESEIDDASFGEVYDQCAELIDDGAGGTHPRHQFDFVFDAEKPIQDAIKEILQPFGMYLMIDEKIRLKILKADDSVFAFDMDNIDEGSFEYSEIDINDSYNEVKVLYSDPNQNDVAIDAKSRDQIDQVLNGFRPAEFSFLGINRFAEASRRAEFIRVESNINKVMCSFTSGLSSMHLTIGDVVTVSHDLPAWVEKLFRIVNIEEENSFKRKYTLKEENASIHNDAMGSVIQTYDYGTPPNPYAPVMDISNLVVAEGAYYLHKDGKVGSDINVSWTAPTDNTRKLLKEYIVELKKGSADYIEVGRTSSTNFTIYGVEDEVIYYIKVRTISVRDIVSNGTVSSSLTVLGKLNPPSNVPAFDVSQQGSLLRFSLSPVTDVDIARYVIKKGPEWSTGSVIAELIDATEFMYPVGEIGWQRFMCKAVDTSGNESIAPALDDINVVRPPDMNFLNEYDIFKENIEYKLADCELVWRNDFNTGYNRRAIALKTVTSWEQREAEGKSWEYQEANNGLVLDGPVASSGNFEMVTPIDLGTIFEFNLILDADFVNVSGGSVTVQVSYSENGTSYSSFADISASTVYRARYVKFKFLLATSDTNFNVYFYGCTIFVNAPVSKQDWWRDVAVPVEGITIPFGVEFTAPPRVVCTISNATAGFIKVTKTATNVTIRVYSDVNLTTPIGTAEVDGDAKGS